ncbi:MAG TPA: cobyrinic acid a,c-diamide synthase [Jatrophihabitantaceae bacterium]|jgi:hypothetical protein
MTRRTSLPGAAELFRATSAAPKPAPEEVAHHPGVGAVPVPPEPEPRPEPEREPEVRAEAPAPASRPAPAPAVARPGRGGRRIRAVGDRTPSGRERHEEKITVYCSAEELVDIETARLHLRAEHGLAVDRGRIVREAVAVVLADLEAKGDSSILVRRLRGA